MYIRSKTITSAAVIAAFLFFSTCLRAEPAAAPAAAPISAAGSDMAAMKTNNGDNAVQAYGQFMAPYTRMKYSAETSASYYNYGRIGFIPAGGFSVDCKSYAYNAGYSNAGFQLEFSKRFFRMNSYLPQGKLTANKHSDIMKVSYTYEFHNSPMHAQMAVGGLAYLDGATHFSQPFAMVSMGSEAVRVSAGANWLSNHTGAVTDAGLSAFGAVQVAVNKKAGFFADYNKRDFQKAIMNDYLLPAVGVDCSMCKKQSLSAGLSMNTYRKIRLTQRGSRVNTAISGSFGIFDINDLKAPFGSLLFNIDL